MRNVEGPFRRFSTLLGFSATAVVITILGYLTHWREYLFPIYCVLALACLWFFSRVFYGLSASRLIDKTGVTYGAIPRLLRWDGRRQEDIASAYEQIQMGNPTEFQRLANEEHL
jgi:hypothetical protein